MPLTMTSAPVAEPMTLAEAKHHLRVDGSSDDAFIQSLITTSRLHVEAALAIALITQSWRYTLDAWPTATFTLPLRPVQSITSITIYDEQDVPAVLGIDHYALDTDSVPARILAKAPPLPTPGRAYNGIQIQFTAGYGTLATDVPGPIRQAIALLIAHWYEHREAVTTGDRGARIPIGVSDLLAPYRIARL